MDVFVGLILQLNVVETVTNQSPATLGWFSVLVFVMWQLYAPKLGIETRISEITSSVNDRIDDVGKRIDSVEERQDLLVGVTEIIAVQQDGVDGEYVRSTLAESNVNRKEVKEETKNEQ